MEALYGAKDLMHDNTAPVSSSVRDSKMNQSGCIFMKQGV